MKKGRFKNVIALSSLLVFSSLTVGLVGCNPGVNTNITIVITGGQNGFVGGTCQLTAQVFGSENQNVTWTSSNTSLATVSETGLVSFLGQGEVDIVAHLESENAQSSPCHIRITQGDARLELTSSPSRLAYKVGETLSFDGMKVTGYSYSNGVRLNNSGVDLTNADLTFSMEEGTTLEEAGSHTITVSYGSFEPTTFTINVGQQLEEKRLYVSQLPTKTTYSIGTNDEKDCTFDSTGIAVQELTYVDGVLKSTENLRSTSYRLSINNNFVFSNEGNFTVSVYRNTNDAVSTSFNVMVYTQDLTLRDLMETLQTTHNFQVEIFNNVGTTQDSYGFHYLRTYTENYYDEISYQNTYNSTTQQIEFTTTGMPKSHIGYASLNYVDDDTNETTNGIVSFNTSSLGRLQYDVIVNETNEPSSWWDMADTLATMMTVFDLDNIPVNTLNGKYLIIPVELVEGDNEDGEQTIKNYPLIDQFFSYVGWSNSLITIADRLTISFNENNELSMRVDFGYYGYTEMIVRDIGTASNPLVDQFLQRGITQSTMNNLRTVKSDVRTGVDPLLANNYTVSNYQNNVGIDNSERAYFTENYMFNTLTGTGFFKLDNGDVYSFAASGRNVTSSSKVDDYDSSTQTFQEYVTSKGTDVNSRYMSAGLSSVLGNQAGEDVGRLYTFSRFDNFSYGDMVTYQSYDSETLRSFARFIGESQDVFAGLRFWICTYYNDVDALTDVYQYEIWAISFTGSGGSGSVIPLINVGNTQLSWLESYMATLEN